MTEEKAEEKHELELRFDKCPNCSSERSVAKIAFKNVKLPGMPDSAKVGFPMGIIDLPSTGIITGEKLAMVQDICADCGTVYMVLSHVQQVPLGMGPTQGKPPFGFTPS